MLLGGRSAEREISLKSGNAVLAGLRNGGIDAHPFDPAQRHLEALAQAGFDRVFIALHGRFGEDGTVQGALEWLGLPYTGSGVLASALALDKWRTKLIWRAAGIPTPPFRLLGEATDFAEAVRDLGLPIMVKPAREGSSIGMTKVERAEDLPEAYRQAARCDPLVLAEAFVAGPELTSAIVGDTALPLIRLETPRVFYDYEAKYFSDSTRYLCPCGLDAAAETAIRQQALAAYRVLGCTGWGRVDLMLDPQGQPYFLEVNTVPGMTDHSLVPMAAKAVGWSFEDLVVRILESAATGRGAG